MGTRTDLRRLLALALLLSFACSQPPQQETTDPALRQLQRAMTESFSGLELYAYEHSQKYPDRLDPLVPKYLDALPIDPKTGRTLTYRRVAAGYLLGTDGDYSTSGAEPGYPRMDQDGFFALKASDFPDESAQ